MTMIEVQVRLFANLRQRYSQLGIGESMTLALPTDPTIEQLLARLKIPAEQVKIVFVNHVVRKMDYCLADGDEVGVFPPVGGG